MRGLQRFVLHITAILPLCAAATFSHGQGNFAGVNLSISPVAGNVFMIQRPGGGGNIGVQVGPDGVLLVDSLFAPLSEKLVAAVKQVTDEEIRFLINTHIHIDHIGGNENLAEMGVLIFAHDNTRLRFFEERSRFPRAGGSFVPQQAEAARPLITFNDAMSFHMNGEEVQAFLAPPGAYRWGRVCLLPRVRCNAPRRRLSHYELSDYRYIQRRLTQRDDFSH